MFAKSSEFEREATKETFNWILNSWRKKTDFVKMALYRKVYMNVQHFINNKLCFVYSFYSVPVFIPHRSQKLKDFINKTINQTNFKFMEKRCYIILDYMDLETYSLCNPRIMG